MCLVNLHPVLSNIIVNFNLCFITQYIIGSEKPKICLHPQNTSRKANCAQTNPNCFTHFINTVEEKSANTTSAAHINTPSLTAALIF